MTISQFLLELKRLAKGSRWTLDGGGVRSVKDGHCPLSFVATKLLDKPFEPCAICGPAKALKLKEKDREAIVDAADAPDGDLRRQLLAAVGLKEKADKGGK